MSQSRLCRDAGESGLFNAQVVIVGSGAGALAIAGELGRQGVDVLLVEAGPVHGSKAAGHRRNDYRELDAFNTELRTKLLPHAHAEKPWPGLPGGAGVHGLGGMMSYWANAVPRPQPCEWDGPISYDALGGLLDRADVLFWSTDELYGEGSARQQWIRTEIARHFGRDEARRNRFAARMRDDGTVEFAGGDALLAEVTRPVRYLTDTVARHVVHTSGRVSAIEAVRSDGSTLRIEADVFVIAAGIIGTPQLLFASGFKELPALGCYLTDHLNAVTRVLLKSGGDIADQPGEPPLGMYFPMSDARPFHASVLDIPSSAHAGVLAGVDGERTTDVGTFIGTEPVETNRLIFDDKVIDGFGLPAVRAEVNLTADDHKRAGKALAWQYEVAAVIGQPWRGMSPLLRPMGSSLHLMGTFRAGNDPADSVIDSTGKVWGHENLFLAGNGVLRSRNSCNPTLTTVALALATADSILGRT